MNIALLLEHIFLIVSLLSNVENSSSILRQKGLYPEQKSPFKAGHPILSSDLSCHSAAKKGKSGPPRFSSSLSIAAVEGLFSRAAEPTPLPPPTTLLLSIPRHRSDGGQAFSFSFFVGLLKATERVGRRTADRQRRGGGGGGEGGRNLPPPPPLSTLAEGGGGIKCVFLPGYVVFCRSVGRSPFFLLAVFSFLLPPQARSNVASFVRSCIAEGGTQRRRRRRRGRSIVSLLLLLRRRPLATTDGGPTGRQSAQRWRLRPEVGRGRYVASRSKGKGRKREKRKEKALRPFFSSRAEKGGLLWSLGMQVAWYRRRRRERTTSRVGGGRRRVVAAAFSFPSLILKRPKKKDKREEERSIFAPSILWGKEGWMQSRSSPSLLELSTREACVCRPRSHACAVVQHTGGKGRGMRRCASCPCVFALAPP